MEKNNLPHLDKLVGVPTNQPDIKNELEQILKERFIHGGERYKDELEKTEKDLLLIDLAQRAVDEILTKYGRSNVLKIPYENIHIFPKGGVEKVTDGALEGGGHSVLMVSCVIDREASDVDFTITTFHELVHAKCFKAAQLTREFGAQNLNEYRAGMAMVARDGAVNYFEDINEAVVGFLTNKFFEEYIRTNDSFKKEIEEREAAGSPVDTSRQKEVQDMLRYIDTLYEKNKDKYSKEEILAIFLDAGINGNLMKLGRLIEGTFGKGSFRELGRQTGYKFNK